MECSYRVLNLKSLTYYDSQSTSEHYSSWKKPVQVCHRFGAPGPKSPAHKSIVVLSINIDRSVGIDAVGLMLLPYQLEIGPSGQTHLRFGRRFSFEG